MRRLLAVSMLAAALWAAPAFSDTYGPPFGANSYSTSIVSTGAVEDTDDYVAPLLAGETLTVTASATGRSSLSPALSLIAPDGVVTALTPPAVVEKKNGSVVTLSRFAVPTTGRWTVRVSGKNGSQGAYAVAFNVGAVRAAKPVSLHLGGAFPSSRDLVVDGIDGALLAVTVKWPKSQAAVHIGAVKDPSGAEKSTGAPPVEKTGSAKLTRRTLHEGAGPYTVHLSIDSGEVDCSVTTTVTPKSRPKGKKVLSSAEPFLDVRTTPLRGDVGLTAHLTGSGFTATPSTPQVFFDGVRATEVVVAADGTSIDVKASAGVPNATCDVVVVTADGQASVRPGYFLCVPPPTITDVTNASGASVLGGSAAGGASMTLVGTGFVSGDVVRFGDRQATDVVVPNSTHAILSTPALAAGMVDLAVEDEFGRTAVAPFQFEYKVPPVFAASAYSPTRSAASGGTTITITGTGFEPTDHLVINGVNRNSTFIDATTRQFTTVAASPGLYRMQLVDRLGVVATGPNLEFKDPPGFASSPYSPRAGTTAGGATITITGNNFELTDQLRLNGTTSASTFVNSTTRRFTSPALSAGVYSVDLTDRYGAQVSGPNFEIKDAPAFSTSPYSPASATSAGGTTITITGTGFESTDQLRLDGSNVASTFVDSTTRRFVTIPTTPGRHAVQLVDRLGQIGTGPNFEIRDPPAFASTPYSPAFSGTAGAASITITGTGFESTDQLQFNGSNLTSTFVNATTRRFTTPAIGAGSYSVRLVDRFNTVVSGPNFDVKDPPTFGYSPYSPAFATTSGGTTVTITGTGFESSDQVRFNGSTVTSTFVGATTRRFNTPAIAVGTYSVQLIDRFNETVSGPTFEIKNPPAFVASPYSPAYGPTGGGAVITIHGTGFESADQLRFNGSNLTSTFVNSTTRTFTSPAAAAGFCAVQLVDRAGQTGTGPNFEVRAAPAISNVQATAGTRIDATHIAAGGGATIQVTGARFAADTTVTLGGAAATVTSQTSTQLVFTAPSAAFGVASLVVSDGVGQTATSTALTFVGFDDQTVNRQPGSSSVDDLMAARGAVGDLDNDGVADDVVITTRNSVGSRSVFTRILFANGGALTDVTDSNFPGVGNWGDPYDANAVAIGDLDGDSVQDIVIAGSPVFGYGGYSSYFLEARVFTNDGSGTFTESDDSPHVRQSDVTCTDAYGATYRVFSPNSGGGNATALAIGDLDGDGDMDMVMTTDHYRSGNVFIPPNYVTFTPGAYYDAAASSHYSWSGTYAYTSATRVFDNQGSSGLVDETFPRMPLCGTRTSYVTSFPGRDVKLGDVDGDGSLDIVMTWDDPTTVSPYGQWQGSGFDSPRVSTQILINDGRGFFTDQTSTWLPSGSSPEFWQGNRVELVDLDGDGRKDLIVLHAQPLDGSTTSRSSLRILKNAGSSQGFVDVTSSALPSVPLSGTLDDNLRGNALLVRDIDGDGKLDIVVGTTERLVGSWGNAVRSTRLLRGDGALHFTSADDFLPFPSVDSGEATDLLLGDVAGNPTQSLILLSETAPAASANGERLRVFDWK